VIRPGWPLCARSMKSTGLEARSGACACWPPLTAHDAANHPCTAVGGGGFGWTRCLIVSQLRLLVGARQIPARPQAIDVRELETRELPPSHVAQ
jgi:hypothetical protein